MSDHSNSQDSNNKLGNLNKSDEQRTAESGSAPTEQEWTEAPKANEQAHQRYANEQQQASPYGQQGGSGQPPYQRPQPYSNQPHPYPGQTFQGQPYQGSSYQGQPYQGQNYQGQSYQGQPYQGQPGYNPGMQYYPQAGYQAITTNTKSIVSLILGILSLIIPYIGLIIGIIGIIISTLSLKELNKRPENGKGLAVTGLVLSIIGTLIYALIIIIIVLAFIFASSSDVYYY